MSKKSSIHKTFNRFSGRMYALKMAAMTNTGSVALTSMMFAPLFLIDPTGATFILATTGAVTGAAIGLPAAFFDSVNDKKPTVWVMKSGQRVHGPSYIQRQSQMLQDAIIDLYAKLPHVSDKERAQIHKILKQYDKYIEVMSKKVTILDAGEFGASDHRLTFVKHNQPLSPKPRQFKK